MDLVITFLGLEKEYERSPRDFVYWCLRKRGLLERLVTLIEATYQGSELTLREITIWLPKKFQKLDIFWKILAIFFF